MRGGPRGRGGTRGNRGTFQWRRNDRNNPGPSRPANPGPNNPNYNQNTGWGADGEWGPNPRENFDDADVGVSDLYRRAYNFDSRPMRDIDERGYQRRGDPDWHPPRYDHHTIREIEKRNQSLMQQSPSLETRRPPSPRVFYPGSPQQKIQSESPSFISSHSPRPFTTEQSENRWPNEKKVRKDLFSSNEEPERPKPPIPQSSEEFQVRTFDYTNQQPLEPVQFSISAPKKFIDYSIPNPLERSTSIRYHARASKSPDSRKKSNRKRRSSSPRLRNSRSPKHKKKKGLREKERSKSSSPSSRTKRSRRKDDKFRKIVEEGNDDQELYEPDSGNEDIGYVPAATENNVQQDVYRRHVEIPQEYSDISVYMTQVLETMMERQRHVMHRKLNEMFKTYFDAKTNADEDVHPDEEEDTELNELRQAAIMSTKEAESLKDGQVNFETFHQFKEYKQKMRDKGLDNESLIVSIPNITANSSLILDKELNLIPKEPILQVKVTNTIDKNSKETDEKLHSENNISTTSESQEAKEQKKSGLKWSDLVYRDPGKHWCHITSKWLNSFSAMLAHLHSEDYQNKLPTKEKPWKKRLDTFNSTLKERDAIKESLKESVEFSKGSEFIAPIQAFKCKLCEKIFRTEADVSAHFLSVEHNKKYEEFTITNPNYEFLRLERMQKSVQEQRRELENQRNMAREKLQMRQIIKEKKRHKSPVRAASRPTMVKNVLSVLPNQNKDIAVKNDNPGLDKSSVEDKKRKPRSAAIERILAMSKKKNLDKKDQSVSNASLGQVKFLGGEKVAEPKEDVNAAKDSAEDNELKLLAVDNSDYDEELKTGLNGESRPDSGHELRIDESPPASGDNLKQADDAQADAVLNNEVGSKNSDIDHVVESKKFEACISVNNLQDKSRDEDMINAVESAGVQDVTQETQQ